MQNISEEYQKLYRIKNRKKNRRLAAQIEKSFECPYEQCYRVYGSDVSLNLHIKLKHSGGNKTDREKLAVLLRLFRNRSAWLSRKACRCPRCASTCPQATWKSTGRRLKKEPCSKIGACSEYNDRL